MKINSLSGLLLGVAFFSAAQIISPYCTGAEEPDYIKMTSLAQKDLDAELIRAFQKTSAVDDIGLIVGALDYKYAYADEATQSQGRLNMIEGLGRFLRHPDEATRIKAIHELAFINPGYDQAAFLAAFIQIKKFDDPAQGQAVQSAALEMIGVMGRDHYREPGYARYLLLRADSETVPAVKASAIGALVYTTRALDAEKVVMLRQLQHYTEPHVKAAAITLWGTLGNTRREYFHESLNVAKEALSIENSPTVIQEAAKVAGSLFFSNHLNENYAGSDADIAGQILPLFKNIIRSSQNDETRIAALWGWAGVALNFQYKGILGDLNEIGTIRLIDTANQKVYDDEVQAVREKIEPTLLTPQP